MKHSILERKALKKSFLESKKGLRKKGRKSILWDFSSAWFVFGRLPRSGLRPLSWVVTPCTPHRYRKESHGNPKKLLPIKWLQDTRCRKACLAYRAPGQPKYRRLNDFMGKNRELLSKLEKNWAEKLCSLFQVKEVVKKFDTRTF